MPIKRILITFSALSMLGACTPNQGSNWNDIASLLGDVTKTNELEIELHRLVAANDVAGIVKLDERLQSELGSFAALTSYIASSNTRATLDEMETDIRESVEVGVFPNYLTAKEALLGLKPCQHAGLTLRAYIADIVTGEATYTLYDGRVRHAGKDGAADNFAIHRARCEVLNRDLPPSPKLVGNSDCLLKSICDLAGPDAITPE